MYGCSPEEFYALPVWRVLRQIHAMERFEDKVLLDGALTVRLGMSESTDFNKFTYALRLKQGKRHKVVTEKNASSLGIAYRKDGKT